LKSWAGSSFAGNGRQGMLFKEFADIDAWPICLATQDVDEIVQTVKILHLFLEALI